MQHHEGPPQESVSTLLKAHHRHAKKGKTIYYIAPIIGCSLTLALWVIILAMNYYGQVRYIAKAHVGELPYL
jgi:hypothetical protein